MQEAKYRRGFGAIGMRTRIHLVQDKDRGVGGEDVDAEFDGGEDAGKGWIGSGAPVAVELRHGDGCGVLVLKLCFGLSVVR